MTTGNQLSKIGILQFTNEEGNQQLGYIFVDSLFATAFIERQVTISGQQVSQICQVVTTETTPTSSSPSAVLEIDSTTGAILVSRLTAAEISALTDPKDGMLVYNTTSNQFNFYQNGAWVGALMGNNGFIAGRGTLSAGGSAIISCPGLNAETSIVLLTRVGVYNSAPSAANLAITLLSNNRITIQSADSSDTSSFCYMVIL